MVAVIKTGHSIRRTFYYNENKLKSLFINQKGEKQVCADLLMATNYPMDLHKMDQRHRLNMLLRTAEKHKNVVRNSVHISLNFAPNESPDQSVLREIANDYMEGIGFGDQPYLVYQHFDAGHTHIHIVSVKIRPNGQRIDMNRIGVDKSEPVRKEIEIKYGLVKAEDHSEEYYDLKPVLLKASYGKSETKRQITNVLDAVIDTYHYSSLEHLNAILKMYNVRASRGNEDSRVFKNNGLTYSILNKQGGPDSVPIKSSLIYSKPGLKKLEKRFIQGRLHSILHKSRIKNAIDSFLMRKNAATVDDFLKFLKKQNIRMMVSLTKTQQVFGMTFIDMDSKCVYKGSDLGKNYSAKAIIERLNYNVSSAADGGIIMKSESSISDNQDRLIPQIDHLNVSVRPDEIHNTQFYDDLEDILSILIQYENNGDYVPYNLRPTRKKRKKHNP